MKRVLIANRGEIALRAVRACRVAGLQSVAVYSTPDVSSPHVWAADQAVCIGPAAALQSYLDEDRLMEVAKATQCDAVYPGYGFLSERAKFAERCGDEGLVFIGPSPDVIEAMGDKAEARKRAEARGVPVVPGSSAAFADVGEAAKSARDIGFPLLLKASAGGGGRGMRVAQNEAAFAELFMQASAEASSAFGNGEIYLERFFSRVRHIEVQIFGDSHGNVRHFGERDCSVQRRHQKIIEEAPSPVLEPHERRELLQSAVALGEAIGYQNAGTVEFIFDVESRRFFFIEMNTRIQVEHPVTEALTGYDLVAEQLKVAAGDRLSADPVKPPEVGAAIEWRICAEDPSRGFKPSPGRIRNWPRPSGVGIRFDTHAYSGYDVPPFYDSMLGKLIVSGRDRREAIARSEAALMSFSDTGIATNVPFHLDLLHSRKFRDAEIHTRWIEEELLK